MATFVNLGQYIIRQPKNTFFALVSLGCLCMDWGDIKNKLIKIINFA